MTPQLTLERPLRFGSRGSALALAQTRLTMERFQALFPNCPTELVIVRTEGDIDRQSSLTEIGGRGVFTGAIEERILDGAIDAAVHSAKDLPTALHPDAPLVAFPDRDDPRDVLVSRHHTALAALPANPVIGTSSRRREAQILRLRPDARIANIRGNIDTRLRKAQSEEFDAIVLAAAGLHRMGWSDRVSQYFAIEELVPSPGQGAIAIQALAGSEAARQLARIDDPRVSTAVSIERAFLAGIGAGCTYPVGAYASEQGGRFRLIAMLADATGACMAFADEPLAPGDELRHAAEIAQRLKAEVSTGTPTRVWSGWAESARDLAGLRVVVTRPRRQAGQLMTVLADRGAEPVSLPTIRIEPLPDTTTLDTALEAAANGAYDWIVFTSANAVEAVVSRLQAVGIEAARLAGTRIAAIGPATAHAATTTDLNVSIVPRAAHAEALAEELLRHIVAGAKVLYPRSAIGRDHVATALRDAGVVVDVIDAYETIPEPEIDPQILEQFRQGEIDAIAFASPSSIQNLISLLGEEKDALTRVPAICAGPVTAQAAHEAGLIVAVISDDPGAAAMADALAKHWGRESGLESLSARETFSETRGR